MECSQIRAILFENADAEIPVEFREGVESHLAECRPCAMQAEALKEQSRALSTLPKVEAPGDFLDQVRSRFERPSVFSMLKQGYSVLFPGKRFFQLAGAAATAVVVIATVHVALRDDSGQKALRAPAPSSVEAPPSAGSPPSLGSPPTAGSSRSVDAPAGAEAPPSFKAPKAAPAKNGKVFDSAAPPAPAPQRHAGVAEQSVVLTVKPPRSSARGKTSGGPFKPESFSAASPSAARPGAQGDRFKQSLSTGGGGRSAAVSEGSPRPEEQKIFSDVIRLIMRANGKVLSGGPARDSNKPETVLAEMPAGNYPSFLDQLRQLGEVESSGDKEFNPAPDEKVRVLVRLGD